MPRKSSRFASVSSECTRSTMRLRSVCSRSSGNSSASARKLSSRSKRTRVVRRGALALDVQVRPIAGLLDADLLVRRRIRNLPIRQVACVRQDGVRLFARRIDDGVRRARGRRHLAGRLVEVAPLDAQALVGFGPLVLHAPAVCASRADMSRNHPIPAGGMGTGRGHEVSNSAEYERFRAGKEETMPIPQDRRPVVWWRLGLLLALGGSILFASFSYDDWRSIGRYLGSEVWQVAARRRAISRAVREQQEGAQRERREAHVDGSIRGLFAGSAQALARCPDGGLVVGGMHSRHGLALARLDADGTLDRAWTDRMAAQSIVGGVDAVSCDDAGLLVSGALLAHRHHPGQVTAARFAPDGTPGHVYGVNDVSWLDRSRSDRIALELRERVGRQLPPRSNLRAVFGGPGASAIAFFDERLPEPEEPSDSWTTLVDVTGATPRRRRVRMPNIYCAAWASSRARDG